MTLPLRILLARGGIRYGGALLFLLQTFWWGWGSIVAAVMWFVSGDILNKYVFLPVLFPATTCSCCGRRLLLKTRWKYGSQYIDHKQRHILNFHTNHGIELGSFKCPHCSATIQVQKGNRERFKHGEMAQAAEFGIGNPQPSPKVTGLLIGTLRGESYSLVQRCWRWIRGLPRQQPVIAPPSVTNTHGYIVGGSGMGKSTLMLNLAKQKFESGDGCLFLDPAGDLSTDLLGLVPEERIGDVLYIKPSDDSLRCSFNIFDAESPIERKVLGDHVIDIFRRLYPRSWGDRLEDIMRMAILATLDSGGSFQDLFDLIADAGARSKTIAKLRRSTTALSTSEKQARMKLVRYFEDEYTRTTPAVRSSLITKLRAIVDHPFVGPMLTARACDIQADDIIKNHKIVIVNLATGSPSDYTLDIIGIFMINKFVAGMYRQQNTPKERRIPFTIFADEFQNFMHKANGIDKIISESRKYKLTLMVANQFLTQLSPVVRDAIFGNIRFITCFGVSADDARILGGQIPQTKKQDFLSLRRGQCIVKLGDDAYPTTTFPPPDADKDVAEKIISANQQQFCQDEPVIPKETRRTSLKSPQVVAEPLPCSPVKNQPVIQFVN